MKQGTGRKKQGAGRNIERENMKMVERSNMKDQEMR